MKKLLLILLCVPLIGFGQEIVSVGVAPTAEDVVNSFNLFLQDNNQDQQFLDFCDENLTEVVLKGESMELHEMMMSIMIETLQETNTNYTLKPSGVTFIRFNDYNGVRQKKVVKLIIL